MPVLFEAPEAADLLGAFVQAVAGGALYRSPSFLLDGLGKQVFAPHVNVVEEPHLPARVGSAPFDNEGVATVPRAVVRDGVVQGYFLVAYSARKLGLRPPATRAARTTCRAQLARARDDFEALLRRWAAACSLTEQIGQGVNSVTGDYSRGAAGFWVENGMIAYPVEEITIAASCRRSSATSSRSARIRSRAAPSRPARC